MPTKGGSEPRTTWSWLLGLLASPNTNGKGKGQCKGKGTGTGKG